MIHSFIERMAQRFLKLTQLPSVVKLFFIIINISKCSDPVECIDLTKLSRKQEKTSCGQ